MFSSLRATLVLLAALTILTGAVYPGAVTMIAQAAFSHRANGSMLYDGDRVIGSELIGQPFSKPGYFWGRLSATQPFPYNAASSAGSNYGPLHPELLEAAQGRIAALDQYATAKTPVPVDLVTASGSGLDPHISPATAEYQVARVAKARHLDEQRVREFIAKHTAGRTFGLLGERRVNVVELNLDLDGVGR